MSKFQDAVERLKKNKAIRESGKHVCIPYPFPRFCTVLPGIERGQNICVTAGPGISKSKFTRYVFIYSVYKFVKDNPECGIKPTIFLFLLEDSAAKVMNNMICHRLNEEYKISISLQELESKIGILPDAVIAKIEECNEYFQDLEKYLKIIDHIHNPFGIYDEVKKYCLAHGTMEYDNSKKDANGQEIQIPKLYTPKDTEEHIIVIVDNLSNLTPEKKHANQWEAIGEWTSKYARRSLCKLYKATVVNIQQQDLESQRLTFSSYQGEAIKDKVKPSLATLGDNKTTSRDYHLVFGLFSPDRYKFETDLDYDIALLQNNYRNLSVLKSNETDSGYELGLYFNGASEKFKELPDTLTQAQDLANFYAAYRKKYGKN